MQLFKKKMVLREWGGWKGCLTLGKRYTINRNGFFDDDVGCPRDSKNGKWTKKEKANVN